MLLQVSNKGLIEVNSWITRYISTGSVVKVLVAAAAPLLWSTVVLEEEELILNSHGNAKKTEAFFNLL